MTDRYIYIGSDCMSFTHGKEYALNNGKSIRDPKAFTDDHGFHNGFCSGNNEVFMPINDKHVITPKSKLKLRTCIARWYNQMVCSHAHWNCDTQIRVIECASCGKRAWIRDYKDLFTHK